MEIEAPKVLTEEVCLVVDRPIIRDTGLEILFKRNAHIPARSKATVMVGRAIGAGTEDEINIMVVEGPSNGHSTSNKLLGIISISGRQIFEEIIEGSFVDMTFEISKSMNLTVTACIDGVEGTYSQKFAPFQQNISIGMLRKEMLLLEEKTLREIEDAALSSDHTAAKVLCDILHEIRKMISQCNLLNVDADTVIKLDDAKRRLAKKIFHLTFSKNLNTAKENYHHMKSRVAHLMNEPSTDYERHLFTEICALEQSFLNSENIDKIQTESNKLEEIRWKILNRTPEFLSAAFQQLINGNSGENNQTHTMHLIENGNRFLQEEDWNKLSQVIDHIWELNSHTKQFTHEIFSLTGVVKPKKI